MASPLLKCPLCCSKTFTCPNSLKHHLLSILENITCPACEKRFENVFDLAMHLGRRCADSEQEIKDFELSRDETGISNNNEETILIASDGSVYSAEIEMVDSLERALLSPDMEKTIENIKVENETESNEDQQLLRKPYYYCTVCNVLVTSVYEHNQRFHKENVLNIVEVNADSTSITSANLPMSEKEVEESYFENDECDDSKEILKEIKLTELPDAVQEKEFWDDKSKHPLHLVSCDVDAVQKLPVLENVNSEIGNLENNKNAIVEFYQCSICAENLASIEDYIDHRCSVKIKKCRRPKHHFKNSKDFKSHMKMYHQQNVDPKPSFICKICNTEFPTSRAFRLHLRMHKPKKLKNVEPPVFYGLSGERLALDVPQEMFTCTICNKPYNKEYKEVHLRSHSKEHNFNCDVCNRKFYTYEDLVIHSRVHSDKKKFSCEYCKTSFSTKERLKAHISGKCQNKEYKCQYCERRFSQPYKKVVHERSHTGEKPYGCEVCGKAFSIDSSLTIHMRTHSGNRPYKCEHCAKRFKAFSTYKNHLSTHSEDRQYICPLCEKSFKSKSYLSKHKHCHTKLYMCIVCNKSFDSVSFKSHKKIHKKQNHLKHKCQICGAIYERHHQLFEHIQEQYIKREQANKVDADAIIETDDYDTKDIEIIHEPILGDADETMLIDIGTESMDSIELHEVQKKHM